MRAYLKETPEAVSVRDLILYDQRQKLSPRDYENLDYWLTDSKESFHGEQVKGHFVFKDHRIPDGIKFPMPLIRLVK